jgi:hypothetical protein
VCVCVCVFCLADIPEAMFGSLFFLFTKLWHHHLYSLRIHQVSEDVGFCTCYASLGNGGNAELRLLYTLGVVVCGVVWWEVWLG